MWVDLAPFFGNAIDGGRHSLWMLRARLPNHPHMCNVALSPSASQRFPWGDLPSTGGWKAQVALGSSVCALALVYGAATLKNMEKASFGAIFLLHSPLVDDLEGILPLCTKELGSVQEISLHYISIAQYSEQCLPGQRSLRPLCSPSSDVS